MSLQTYPKFESLLILFNNFQDPTNPLSKEVQKDWKEQGHKNVLTKNTIEAMGWAYVSIYHTNIYAIIYT